MMLLLHGYFFYLCTEPDAQLIVKRQSALHIEVEMRVDWTGVVVGTMLITVAITVSTKLKNIKCTAQQLSWDINSQ